MKTSTRIALAVTGAAAAAALVAGIAPTMVSGTALNADLTPGSSSAKEAPNPEQSTVGFDYWNASAETFRYLSKTGKVAAPPTGDFLPGTKQNLEVPYNVIHDDDSTVTWGIYGFDGGPQVGTLTTSVNNAGESSVSLLGMDGKNLTTMTYKSSGGAWVIEDAAGSPAATAVNTYPAGSTDEQTAISNLCRNVDVTSSCSFAPTSQDVNAYGARPSELGVLYNSSSSSTQLTVGESQSYSVTDSWGATVTGQGTIEALQLGIQASYNHSISTTDTWSTQAEEDVPSLQTGFIWGFAPVIDYTGTFTLKIGNTTFSAPGATYSVPDKTRPILYVPQTFQGDTADNPQPPTQAQALAAARKGHRS